MIRIGGELIPCVQDSPTFPRYAKCPKSYFQQVNDPSIHFTNNKDAKHSRRSTQTHAGMVAVHGGSLCVAAARTHLCAFLPLVVISAQNAPF